MVEVLRYMGGDIDPGSFFDPATGMPYYKDYQDREPGMYPVVKIEYKYDMKNFFGHTFGTVIPELYGFNLNNAPYRISLRNEMTGGALEYHKFNEGGYPQSIGFVYSNFEDMDSFNGEIKIDYIKKE